MAVLAGHCEVEIVAVFERSFHVAMDGQLACIGDASIGDGPLNAIVDPAGEPPSSFAMLAAGRWIATSASASRPARNGLTIDVGAARLWRPRYARLLPGPAFAPSLVLRELGRLSPAGDPLVVEPTGVDRLTRKRLAARLERLAAALAARASRFTATSGHPHAAGADATGMAAITDAAIALLGLGQGLTPSGDDMLCGALLGLRLADVAAVREPLARAVLAAAPARTSSLSVAFLRAAADGLPCAAVDDLLVALVTGETTRLPAIRARLDRLGHSSGRDMLAGVIMALEAQAPATAP